MPLMQFKPSSCAGPELADLCSLPTPIADRSREQIFGDIGGLIRQRTFRSLRCVIPGLVARRAQAGHAATPGPPWAGPAEGGCLPHDRKENVLVLLCLDAAAAARDLAAGTLACPSCTQGQLARWGHGTERVIRLRDGRTARLRPDRARCRSCRRTHILLPSWCAPRRADGIEVIGAVRSGSSCRQAAGQSGSGIGWRAKKPVSRRPRRRGPARAGDG
jgi:hypothetical protein